MQLENTKFILRRDKFFSTLLTGLYPFYKEWRRQDADNTTDARGSKSKKIHAPERLQEADPKPRNSPGYTEGG